MLKGDEISLLKNVHEISGMALFTLHVETKRIPLCRSEMKYNLEHKP